ncbi:DUF6193 family natural product biosynthesis protein [Streptomyces sp. NPDC002908]|uniref:DUF6193 family natural product biosynthesis protein n=1 Tax=Streptomyces sp. NPDC002908 TaxID=3364670 RepID=UPI00367CCBCC
MPEQLSGAAPGDALRSYATLYPDVVRAGSLRNALQTVADRAGYDLAVELTASPGWRYVAAKVTAGDRSANALMAMDVRSFAIGCWVGTVHMADGSTDDLSEAAGALHSWLQVPRVRDLVTRRPFMRTWALAEAHERGQLVPARWHQLRTSGAGAQNAELRALVEAAFDQPALRALSPGRSMYWLTFSRRAAPPLCRDLPGVMPLGNGRYRVRHADGRLLEADGATEAVAAVLAGLPADVAAPPETA